jgi:hypothetical protein
MFLNEMRRKIKMCDRNENDSEKEKKANKYESKE